jgi:CDGSH-type Zn-finger protein
MSNDETATAPVTLTLKPAGPIVIQGPVVILNNAGDPVEPPVSKIPGQIKLCGCGFSKNRPFCDGSHSK